MGAHKKREIRGVNLQCFGVNHCGQGMGATSKGFFCVSEKEKEGGKKGRACRKSLKTNCKGQKAGCVKKKHTAPNKPGERKDRKCVQGILHADGHFQGDNRN